MGNDTLLAKQTRTQRISTGIAGLDEILNTGLIPGRAYQVRGGPGTGKTTLGLHFLTAGDVDETMLLITFDEPEARIRTNARAIGLDVSKVHFLDLSPTSEFFTGGHSYDIFTPAEVEVEPTARKIVEQVEALQPQRILLEGLTQFRYLSPDVFQFHKQVLSFLRFLTDHGATVLFTSESSSAAPDDDLQFLSDGIFQLDCGAVGRTLTVAKFRGSGFHDGPHAIRLNEHGMEVFPQLVPERHGREYPAEAIPSGVPALDELLHGGLERGTVTLITGPSGSGKTTVGVQFMKEAAGRGERSVVYTFEEGRESLLWRCEAINIPARTMMERGTLAVEQIEPMLYSPNEFASMVRREVEEQNARIVMIDSLAGYRLSMRGDNLIGYIHSLTKYLKNMGVTVLLINEVEAITGDFRVTELGISYLADNIVFLHYVEMNGELHKAIGVLKKRMSAFQRCLREIEITRYGIEVGRPLTGLRGILSGMPTAVPDLKRGRHSVADRVSRDGPERNLRHHTRER